MPKGKQRPRNKPQGSVEVDDRAIAKPEGGGRAGPRWLMGKNDKFGLNDLFRLARNYYAQNTWDRMQDNDSQEAAEEAADDYADSLEDQIPGQGQYIGDLPGMGAVPGVAQNPATAPTGGLGGSVGSGATQDPWQGFWPTQAPPSGSPAFGGGTDLALSNASQQILGQMGTPQAGATPHVPVNSKGGALSPVEIAKYAYDAGFRGDGLRQIIATAFPESGGRPSAHNPNAGTGDNSYGLWQINMLGNLGPERLRQFGINSYEDLFDPATNARAAYIVSGGGKNLSPWSAYKKGLHQQYLDEADAAIAQLQQQLAEPPPDAVTGGIVEEPDETEEEKDE